MGQQAIMENNLWIKKQANHHKKSTKETIAKLSDDHVDSDIYDV